MPVTENDYVDREEPFQLFQEWFKEAELSEPNNPNAAALSTVDETGMPNARMVLFKDFGYRGFVFYTNYSSTKGRELLANPKAAVCFHWKFLCRQFRLRGLVEKVDDIDADTYYASRPREHQISAWASKQSQPLPCRFVLDKEVMKYTTLYAFRDIPRPSWWSGFRIRPLFMEFWNERSSRLHERIVFSCNNLEDSQWKKMIVYP
ncbi:pyridoxamine 5'-phosphate oxidase [Liberibacter crescens]|nr:pyridoxamine 5'-phosphate oxidase [Liberibacter crescens]